LSARAQPYAPPPGCLQQLAVLHQWHHRPPANPAPQPAAAAEMSARRSCVLLLGAIGSASASDNGRARQPPMGCESVSPGRTACLSLTRAGCCLMAASKRRSDLVVP
jgi:hypothetical protein